MYKFQKGHIVKSVRNSYSLAYSLKNRLRIFSMTKTFFPKGLLWEVNQVWHPKLKQDRHSCPVSRMSKTSHYKEWASKCQFMHLR